MMDHSESNEALLEVRGLTLGFDSGNGIVDVVRDAGFTIAPGETAALAGESGCGKTVTALALTRLLASPPARYRSGSIRFRGQDILALPAAALRALRGRGIAYIFQDPATALNPVLRIGVQLRELLDGNRQARQERARQLLGRVDLSPPERILNAYPHELSGGMQQRVVIAMAIARQPALLVADEPTTALDVTIQARILALIRRLQRESGMAMLLITHNLGLVAQTAKRVHIMYAGSLVESGDTRVILTQPAHPYTRGLLDAVPRLDQADQPLAGIPGVVPSPDRRPPGCPFADRCPRVSPHCRTAMPDEEPAANRPNHRVRCFQPLPSGDPT